MGFSIFGCMDAKEGKVPESVNSMDIFTLDHNRLSFSSFPVGRQRGPADAGQRLP